MAGHDSDALASLSSAGNSVKVAGSKAGGVAKRVAIDIAGRTAKGAIKVKSFVVKHPRTCATVAVTVATGGAAFLAAPAIAATAGGLGMLGATGAGTAIGSLSGAALANASLAALGGGAVAAGGGGMAAGTAVVTGGGAFIGMSLSGGTAVLLGRPERNMDQDA